MYIVIVVIFSWLVTLLGLFSYIPIQQKQIKKNDLQIHKLIYYDMIFNLILNNSLFYFVV